MVYIAHKYIVNENVQNTVLYSLEGIMSIAGFQTVSCHQKN